MFVDRWRFRWLPDLATKQGRQEKNILDDCFHGNRFDGAKKYVLKADKTVIAIFFQFVTFLKTFDTKFFGRAFRALFEAFLKRKYV